MEYWISTSVLYLWFYCKHIVLAINMTYHNLHYFVRAMSRRVCEQKLEEAIQKDVDVVVEQARTDPQPAEDTIYHHVYSKSPAGYQVRSADGLLHPTVD